jgi:hypothetical protein
MEITTQVLPDDMTPEEQKSLQEYISNGCPGLVKIDDAKVFSWLNLYMNGKSYAEIAHITKDKKDLVLYIAHRSKWFLKRVDYYGDISTGIATKMRNTKIQSADTVLNIISALGQFYNDKANKYLATNDSSIIEEMDTKNLASYYKALEVLEKLISPSGNSESDKPTVNINLGTGGATVTQRNDKTVDITTNPDSEEAAGNLLKALAKFQRSKDS